MKQQLYTLTLLACGFLGFSQNVGINTKEPKATLDINGDLRVRKVDNTNAQNTNVLSIDEDGFVFRAANSTSYATIMEGATFVPAGNVTDIVSNRTPTLDLWTQQETDGVESIKRYYFLGQRHIITLPKNISKQGEEVARVITLIMVKNNEFGGATLSGWDLALQTKLYEVNSDTHEGNNAGTFLYQSSMTGSDLGGTYQNEGNVDGYRRRVYMREEGRIADREINLYDFGGKWIMTVND